MIPTNSSYEIALRDFVRARKRAAVRQLLARLRGESDELLSFDDVRAEIEKETDLIRQDGVQEIPLTSIIGSVGRYKDFTRDFLPIKVSDQERWARVRASLDDMKGWSPIEVYQLGDVYFVQDGNHRVSVARQLGVETISAHVMLVPLNVPLTPEDDPDEVIGKARHADFLAKTQLDVYRPKCQLSLTFHSQYDRLLLGIMRYAQRIGEPNAFSERAVTGWYDGVYLPVIQLARREGTLQAFPQRTEADLYILFAKHQADLDRLVGWEVTNATVVTDFTAQQNKPSLLSRLTNTFIPTDLKDGPDAGSWRRGVAKQKRSTLFADILVSVQGTEADWRLLAQTIEVAGREGGHIHGIYISSNPEKDRGKTADIQAEFTRQCTLANIESDFSVEQKSNSRVPTLLRRARWVDLVCTNLTGPFDQSFLNLTSKVDRLIQQCPRPLLTLPDGNQSPMDNALLGFDGSPKSREALSLAAYLTNRWQMKLTVITVVTENTRAQRLDEARNYLQAQKIEANYVLREKPIADAVLETAETHNCNLMIIGGFGFRPMRHIMLGSTVDHALRRFKNPILICR